MKLKDGIIGICFLFCWCNIQAQTFHVQDGVTYEIENDTLRGWTGTPDTLYFQKPIWNGSLIIEDWDAEDQDIEDEENTTGPLETLREDGLKFYNRARRRMVHRFNTGAYGLAPYKNIRLLMQPVLDHLRNGDWDLAQDEIGTITRPNGIQGNIFDFIENKINNYN